MLVVCSVVLRVGYLADPLVCCLAGSTAAQTVVPLAVLMAVHWVVSSADSSVCYSVALMVVRWVGSTVDLSAGYSAGSMADRMVVSSAARKADRWVAW